MIHVKVSPWSQSLHGRCPRGVARAVNSTLFEALRRSAILDNRCKNFVLRLSYPPKMASAKRCTASAPVWAACS